MATRRRYTARDDTRGALLRSGLELLTERGFTGTGIEEILRRVGVPKGSFYHFFPSKSEFGMVLIAEYNNYFRRRITLSLRDSSRTAPERILALVADLSGSMEKHAYRRGCLIGNLGQEFGGQDEAFRVRLEQAFAEWERLLAGCLRAGIEEGSIPADVDAEEMAAFFWTGWEGAVLRAKVTKSGEPLARFGRNFLRLIRATQAASRPPTPTRTSAG